VLRELPAGTDEERLERAFRLCVARRPRAEELSVLAGLLAAQRAAFGSRPADAIVIAGQEALGSVEDPVVASVIEHAAWSSVAAVLLNLHETVTKN
jgi:hypothetical protein